jgi:hypothetical protein
MALALSIIMRRLRLGGTATPVTAPTLDFSKSANSQLLLVSIGGL